MQRSRSGFRTRARTYSFARESSLWGSPAVLATCVVTLVVGIGSLSTWHNYRALRQTGELWASETLHAQSTELHGELEHALGTADALLDRLAPQVRALDETQDAEQLLTRMYGLATARSGLTWMSASLPDGRFIGVYVDERGELRGQTSRLTAEGTLKQTYRFAENDALLPLATEISDYDPRTRPFYKLAVAKQQRTWTHPYTFFSSYRTGISRVEAVFGQASRPASLRFVLTVDYDTKGLERLLQHPLTESQRQLVLAADGSVLAASGVPLPPPTNTPEHALNWTELEDRPLARVRARASQRVGDGVDAVLVDGEVWRVRQVQLMALDGAPVRLLSMLPERELFARARSEAWRGVLATGVTGLLGLALALVLSSNIARLRRQRAEAERAAESAREEVAELGSYQLLEPIAVGGMGEVFRARHKLLARDAALKLIKSGEAREHEGEDTREARFFQEARVLASLRSAHTVAVYDFGVATDGRYFLAMELLDGLNLESLVRDHGPQPPARVAALLADACDSLAEAHASGLVHRDIKPANMFLCRMAEWLDVLKVLDFGLTRAVGSNTSSPRVEGTPGYMSPEQARGEPLGPSSDLYSLGCVGYWLLSGQHPYDAEGSLAMMEAHVSAAIPELPAAVRARTPPALAQLLTRCMAKRVEHRPVSAEQLGRVLRRIQSECADTFPPELRSRFWAAREVHRRSPIVGDPTVSLAAVRRDGLRVAG